MIYFLHLPGDGANGLVATALKHPAGPGPRGLALVRGGVPAETARVPPGAFLTFVATDPVARAIACWHTAERQPGNPHHPIAHTLLPREIIEDNHPFAAQISDALTRALSGSNTPDLDAALRRLDDLQLLVGFPDALEAYAAAFTARAGLPADALGPQLLRVPRRDPLPRPRVEAFERFNQRDLALLDELHRRRGARPVLASS